MRKTTTNALKSTKNILGVSLCAIVCLILSFTMFLNKTSAEGEVPVDFIVATTNIRESNKYDNDTITQVWEKAEDGRYVHAYPCYNTNHETGCNGLYYLISSGTKVDDGILVSFSDGTNTIENDGTNVASINDYYKYDGTKFVPIQTTEIDANKYYRYSDSNCTNLSPFGNYIKKDSNITQLTETNSKYNTSAEIREFKIDNQTVYMLVGDVILERDASGDPTKVVKGYPTYNLDYNFGYNYKEFSNDTPYVNIGSTTRTNQTISSFAFTIDDASNTITVDPKKEITINPYLLVPATTIGDVISVNKVWINVEYCHSDGTTNELSGISDYVIIQKNLTAGTEDFPTLIWGKLNTNKYYVRDVDGTYKEVSTDSNGGALPILRAYRINTGLYYQDDEGKYISVENYRINSLTEISIDLISNDGTITKTIDDFQNKLFKSNYYYDIYQAIYDPVNSTEIIGYELYNYELKAQSNYKDSGAEALLSTYFVDDELDRLYYLDFDSDNKEEFVPLFNDVLVNNSKSKINTSSSVILDNYSIQESLYKNDDVSLHENVNNLYVSFGDIYYSGINENIDVLLTSLNVSIQLYNTYYNGITIVANDSIRQDQSYVTESNSTPIANYFWFQYFDLRNLRYYTKTDRSEIGIVEHSAGEYRITFTYNTYDITTGFASTVNQTTTYSIYIDETSNKTAYPTINNETPKTPDTTIDYLQYYYNFQNVDTPELIFNASEFKTSYSYNYGQYSVINENNFWISSRTYNKSSNNLITYIDKSNNSFVQATQLVKEYSETGVIDWLQSGYIDNEAVNNILIERTKITAKATIISHPTLPEGYTSTLTFNNLSYSKIAILEYTYQTKTEELSLGSSDYLEDNFGLFDKKIIVVIGYDDKSTPDMTDDEYHINYYLTTSENASLISAINYIYTDSTKEYNTSIIIPNNYSSIDNIAGYNNLKKDASDEYYLVNKGFASEKYDFIFNFEAINFDYIIIEEFDQLGEYTIELEYVTSTSNLNGNGSIVGISYGTYSGRSTNFRVISEEVEDYNISHLIAREYDLEPGTFKYMSGTEEKYVKYIPSGYRIDIFGVKSYFNRYDINTQSIEKTELKQKTENIYSDLTPYIEDLDGNGTLIEKGCTLDPTTNKSIIKVPNTNQVPVYFDYLCNYAYTSKKVSESYIYRYTSFVYNDDKTCEIKNKNKVVTNYFDKDSRPEDDGYYEIIIKYSYDDASTFYYQVFAFVIDNASPEVAFETLKETVETETFKYSSWKTMSNNIYTNSPVRATWRTATFFQYEVVPTLSKSAYSGVTSAYGSTGNATNSYNLTNPTNNAFNIYLAGSIYTTLQGNVTITLEGNTIKYGTIAGQEAQDYYITTYDNINLSKVPLFKIVLTKTTGLDQAVKDYIDNYINGVSFYPSDMYNQKLVNMLYSALNGGATMQFELVDYKWQFITYATSTYHDEFKIKPNFSTGNIWGSGNYSLKLTYGSSANSNITSSFIIDTLPITNITSKKVAINETSNQISTEFMSGSNNLINEPFTLIYDKKSSGAPIKANYYAIPLNLISTSDYSSVNLNLTNSKVGINTDISLSTATTITLKNYNYDHSYRNLGDSVPSSNVLQSSSSSLFVFTITDDAGNISYYYVLYDTSTPKHHLTLADEDKNSTEYIQYRIITKTTTLFWGNYKAIEIDASSKVLDLKYVKNNADHINYLPTAIEQALADINSNSNKTDNSKYLKTLFKTFWNIDGQWEEVNYSDEEAKVNYYSTLLTQGKTVKIESNSPVERYFLMIPLSTATFKYSTTSGNDYTTKTFDFNMSLDTTANSTIISPSVKELAKANGMTNADGVTVSDSTIQNIKNQPMGTYGFYGQNTYLYTIYDVLDNNDGGDFWMNNDLTKAFAWVLSGNSNNELTEGINLDITNTSSYSAYATSQLYFSYQDQSTNASIPTADFAYKYYPFADEGFYTDYAVSNITTDATYQYGNSYTIEFSKILTDEYGNTYLSNETTDKKTYTVNETDTYNYNQDGEIVNEKLSTYPFSLAHTGEASKNGWIDLDELSTYTYKKDTNRKFTTLINEQDMTATETSENLSTGIYTAPGLYVFRRVYTDYLKDTAAYNNSGIAIVDVNSTDTLEEMNDQVIQYYFYYIDRNSIIHISDDLVKTAIGSDISITLGDYIDAATEKDNNLVFNENYKTVLDYSEIKNNSSADTNKKKEYASKQIIYNNNFTNNKTYTSYNIPLDKYNQPKIATNFLENYNLMLNTIDNRMENAYALYFGITDDSKLSNEEKQSMKQQFYNEFIAKYLFDNQTGFADNIYYNQMFMLDIQLSNGATNIINNNEIVSVNKSYLNYYNNGNEEITVVSAQNSRQELTYNQDPTLSAIVLNSKTNEGKYSIFIQDRAYIDKTDQKITADTFTGNSYSHDFTIATKVPSAELKGKEINGTYNTNSSSDYARALFLNNAETNTGDIDRMTSQKTYTDNTAIYVDSNNQTLILYIDNSQIDATTASTNPYQIQINKTDDNGIVTTIFKTKLSFATTQDPNDPTKHIKNAIYTYEACSNTEETMKLAFMDNSEFTNDNVPTKWAIVVFDAFAQDTRYHNLLSNAKDNATYTFTIYHFGTEKDYIGNQPNGVADYSYEFNITIDHTKPILNQIKLMEQDNFVDKKGITFTTYNNVKYTNITEYNNILQSAVESKSITMLTAQKYLQQIYDTYIKYYKNTTIGNENYINELDDQYGDKAIYWNNYYFTINCNDINGFTFDKTLLTGHNGGCGLDSYQYLYFRQINDIDKYKHSLTTDDFLSTADTALHEHSIFYETYASKTEASDSGNDTYFRVTTNLNEPHKLTLNESTFENNKFYEVIERDEAGNFCVYLIKTVSNSNEYGFTYQGINNAGEIPGTLTASNIALTKENNSEIMGTEFAFDVYNVTDKDALRIDLVYSFISINANGSQTIYSNINNPISLYTTLINNEIKLSYNPTSTQIEIPAEFLEPIQITTEKQIDGTVITIGIRQMLTRLNEIISYISTSYKANALDFEFNITLYERYLYQTHDEQNYELDVLMPGKELELNINYSSEGINISIPSDQGGRSTKITYFSVSKRDPENNNVFGSLYTDSRGTSFNYDDLNNKTSLGGKNFYFKYYTIAGNYEPYKITTIDNFGRRTTYTLSKPDSTKYNINYGKTETYYDETYTASDIVVTYNSSAYTAIILEDVSEQNTNRAYLVDTALDKTDDIARIESINTNLNNNYIIYDGENDKWTRYNSNSANIKEEIYSISRVKNGSVNTITISQKVDRQSKFIILIIENASDDAMNYLYTYGYFAFFLSQYANESVYYNDNNITLYTYIPEIQLTNLSGKIITTSKKVNTNGDLVFIEPLLYKIKTNEELFSPYSTITKNGIVINSTSEPLNDGKYTISISNTLGYTGESSKITFEINSNSATSDYSIYSVSAKGTKNNLQRSTSYVTSKDSNRVYHYYALNEFNNYVLVDGKYQENKTKAHIEIITNTNNLVSCYLENYVNDPTNEMGIHALYKVVDNNNSIIEYFMIHFIEATSGDFSKLYISNDRTIYNPPTNGYSEYSFSYNSSKLYLMFSDPANTGSSGANYLQGNTMTLTYYYNSVSSSSPTQVSTIDKLSKYTYNGNTYYIFEISATGIHKFVITDLAGNVAKFKTQNYLEIYLVNSILYQINETEPIQNYITNNEVTLTLIDKVNGYQLYELNNEVSVTKNGQPYTTKAETTNVYKFTETGTYVVTVTGTNIRNSTNQQVSHTIEFTIVNPNVAYNSYAISSAKGFTVVSVNRKLENTENARDNYLPGYKDTNSLLIDCENTGAGYYTITLSKYLDSIKRNVEFSFSVWLNDRTDSTIIYPSIPFGTETTDIIELRFNPANIYNNVGDSYITINGEIVETITKESVSETKTLTIETKGVYWIRIVSANNQVIASYKLTKNDPLNTTAQIIIIVAVVAVVALVVIFIILRRKTRFR